MDVMHQGLPAADIRHFRQEIFIELSSKGQLLPFQEGTGVCGSGSYQLKPDVLSCLILHFTPTNQLTLFKIQTNSQNLQKSAYIFMLTASAD